MGQRKYSIVQLTAVRLRWFALHPVFSDQATPPMTSQESHYLYNLQLLDRKVLYKTELRVVKQCPNEFTGKALLVQLVSVRLKSSI